jgi:hypothetical protein
MRVLAICVAVLAAITGVAGAFRGGIAAQHAPRFFSAAQSPLGTRSQQLRRHGKWRGPTALRAPVTTYAMMI